MGTPRCLVPRVPPGAQAPNGSQRTVNGPLTDPLTGNGRIPPLTVSGVRELRLVASTVAYSRLYAGDDKIDDAPLFSALAVLVGTWAVALGTFLLSIDRTHLSTFVSTETGPEFTRRRFDHFAGNDERRMILFGVHPSIWASFAGVVQAWVTQQYLKMSAQPWFTP
jgi:hypothetical protein